eukprot:gene550-694_t
MDILFSPYVSKRAQSNIKNYKYNGCDHSIIANHLMQPFWRYSVEYLPMWLAPNLITLIGFIFILASYITTSLYIPTISGEAPSWVYLFNALCIFVYQTMDALDGKQARRTGSSSGLGELFDHGCDAMTTFLVILTFQSSLQMGTNFFTLFTTMIILVAFYMTQWEQYHTDVMELGYIGVTEGQFSMITGHLITFVMGPAFWLNSFTLFGYQIHFNTFVIGFSVLGAFGTIFTNIQTVVKKGPKSFKGSILQIIPIVFITFTSLVWAYYSKINILGRIVLARICADEFTPFQIILLPLVLMLVNLSRGFELFNEWTFLVFYCAITIIVYFHFAYIVINNLCNVLGIHCFKLKLKKNS